VRPLPSYVLFELPLAACAVVIGAGSAAGAGRAFSSIGESGGGGMSVPAVKESKVPRTGKANLPFEASLVGMIAEVCPCRSSQIIVKFPEALGKESNKARPPFTSAQFFGDGRAITRTDYLVVVSKPLILTLRSQAIGKKDAVVKENQCEAMEL